MIKANLLFLVLFFHNSFRRFSIEPKNDKKNGNHTFSRMVAKFAFYCKI